MPNPASGRVRLRLACADGRVGAVQVCSERPDVAGVLRGRSADQAVQALSLLFALCRQGQRGAAGLALAAARGDECIPRLDIAVQHEALREHLGHCLLDLPVLLGDAPLQQEFIAAAECVKSGRRGELHALLTSPRIAALFLQAQQDEAPDAAPSLLPSFTAQTSLQEWPRLSAGFCRRPEWRGAAAETGVVTRHRLRDGQTGARWMARYKELLDWANGAEQAGCSGTVSAAPVASGVGRALVETARGLLMHEVALDGERVADYLIVAPTEWNFHPQSSWAKQMLGLDARDRESLQRRVARLVAALDPCVPWELEWA